ncbi:MAG: type IV secretion system protein VirB10 [Burkholderiales bacterium]|nr:type IV secretion system protein VirB10 [Burkholderiales bacterium]
MSNDVRPDKDMPDAAKASGDSATGLESEAGIPSVSQPRTVTVSRKGLFALAFFAVSLVAVSAVSIHRAFGSKNEIQEASKRVADRPAAAGTEPRRLDLTLPVAASAASAPAGRMIPAIQPLPDDGPAQPIPVRRNETPRTLPEDAPAVLLSSRPGITGANRQATAVAATGGEGADKGDPLDNTRRNLDAYQQRLQGLLDTLTARTDAVTKSANGTPSLPLPLLPLPTGAGGTAPAGAGLFGGQLQGSATPRVVAGSIANRSLTLPKGTAFTCALKTRLVNAASGFVSCQVLRNVFSEDGRVLLIERGSHLDGEYRTSSARPGTVRIPVLWTRLRTPNAVTVDIESPGTGALGESGIDGYVDNRWFERIGAAMLLSVINDAMAFAIQKQTSSGDGDTILLPATTGNTSKLAEKVLDSTINIPPLIYQNQGAVVGIYVARDVDFSSVYELKAVER